MIVKRMLAVGVILLAAVALPGCGQTQREDPEATQRMEDVKANIKKQLDVGFQQHKQSGFKDVPPGVQPPAGFQPPAAAQPPGGSSVPPQPKPR
jgi:hypothetical protein